MQIVTVSGNSVSANYQDLCDKLTQYGTGYFDRYEFDDTNTKVDCYLGDDVVLSFKHSANRSAWYYSQNAYLSYLGSGCTCITRLIVCDNCIGLIVDSSNQPTSNPAWSFPKFFAKKADGSTIFVYPSSSPYGDNIQYITAWSSGTFIGSSVGVISFDATTHEARKSFIPVASVNLQSVPGADTTSIEAMQLYDPYDGVAIKDLYFIHARGASQYEPGYFSVDGVRYVGMGRYTFASKENTRPERSTSWKASLYLS